MINCWQAVFYHTPLNVVNYLMYIVHVRYLSDTQSHFLIRGKTMVFATVVHVLMYNYST